MRTRLFRPTKATNRKTLEHSDTLITTDTLFTVYGVRFDLHRRPIHRSVGLNQLRHLGSFLQGLDYGELVRIAKQLGYESRFDREVFIAPPENVWQHFRALLPKGADLHVQDNDRANWVLECLRAMHGFADAPLMFQLCLIYYLIREAGAIKSTFDDHYVMIYYDYGGFWELIIVLTIHVDDLLLAASRSNITWLQNILEKRFGKLKKRVLPFTHTGLQFEMVNPDCLRIHQDDFNRKLQQHDFGSDAKDDLERMLIARETTSFRSITCACLWGAQTRNEELCAITSLQQKLKEPQVKDLLLINQVIKRLKAPDSIDGIYFWRLTPPLHQITVTDASGANKRSDYSMEGICLLISEDRVGEPQTDQQYFFECDQVSKLGGKCHLMLGTASKSKRISHSTSHAETLAAAHGLPMGNYLPLVIPKPT